MILTVGMPGKPGTPGMFGRDGEGEGEGEGDGEGDGEGEGEAAPLHRASNHCLQPVAEGMGWGQRRQGSAEAAPKCRCAVCAGWRGTRRRTAGMLACMLACLGLKSVYPQQNLRQAQQGGRHAGGAAGPGHACAVVVIHKACTFWRRQTPLNARSSCKSRCGGAAQPSKQAGKQACLVSMLPAQARRRGLCRKLRCG